MAKSVVVDTNLLLDDPNVLYKFLKDYDEIIIPVTVAKELDDLKFKPFTAYSARAAIRTLVQIKKEFPDNFKCNIDFDTNENPTNDQKIIQATLKTESDLATKDVSMSFIAEAYGIKTTLFDEVMNGLFTPYIYLSENQLLDLSGDNVFTYQQCYEKKQYTKVIKTINAISEKELLQDAWMFVIIQTSDEPIVYANNPVEKLFVRIDNDPKYREIVIDKSINIEMYDVYQNCALYAMIEAPNTLICGSYGSGKSLLATAYSVAYNTKKTFISRPNLSIDKRFDLGFLPGKLDEKLLPWMAGILSSLYAIYSNTKNSKSSKMETGSTYDYVKDRIFPQFFELMPIDTIQGMSFIDGDMLVLDEVQLCSINVLSLILSRFGKGSKLIATGDVKQVYNTIPVSENGLIKLLRLLPNKYMAYIELKENYRGELLELADDLQNKLIV